MRKLLFFHGGPGLNSNPERHMLRSLYEQHGIILCTWDEPSGLRGTANTSGGQTRFEQLLKSAEDFLLMHFESDSIAVAGHSMGCQIVAWLMQRHNDKIKTVFMIGPCFHLYNADRRVFNFIAGDLKKEHNLAAHEKMQSIINNISGRFDDNAAAGWQLALSNAHLFDFYWSNNQLQQTYLSYFTAPQFSVDTESFFEVRKSYYAPELTQRGEKTVIIHASSDNVMSIDEDISLIKNKFPANKVYALEGRTHFIHIEEARSVLDIIAREIYR